MTGIVRPSMDKSSVGMARLSSWTAPARKRCAGTSHRAGPANGMGPTLTLPATTSPLRRWRLPTKVSYESSEASIIRSPPTPWRLAMMEVEMFQTEFEFTLPCGYLDEDGT